MSFDDLLNHTLVIRRLAPTLDVDGAPILDAYGQPVSGEVTLATVAGRIEPRSAREVALLSGAGAVVSTDIGYLYPLAGLGTDCWIESEGIRYDITAMPDAAGQGHHLELALTAVT
jgi:hypothetical protein